MEFPSPQPPIDGGYHGQVVAHLRHDASPNLGGLFRLAFGDVIGRERTETRPTCFKIDDSLLVCDGGRQVTGGC